MNTIPHDSMYWKDGRLRPVRHDLLAEEPLSIRVQGKPYAVVMRTPGEEMAHVAGFCLTEGIVETLDDFQNLAFCDGADTNVVTVTLKDPDSNRLSEIMDRRGYISQTSCGICGKELVKDLEQFVRPIETDLRLDLKKAAACLHSLPKNQPLRDKTRAAHGAAVFNATYELLAWAEDVGRHNALDKVIGKLFLDKKLDQAALLILSSRISYELVQKAARAAIPVIMAFSRPTALAVNLAQELNMTLACLDKDLDLILLCGRERFVGR